MDALTPKARETLAANLRWVVDSPKIGGDAKAILAQLRERREARAGAMTERVQANGFTPSQQKFLGDALREAIPDLPDEAKTEVQSERGGYSARTIEDEMGVRIHVPGGPSLYVGSKDQARELLKRIGEEKKSVIPIHVKALGPSPDYFLVNGVMVPKYVHGGIDGAPFAGHPHLLLLDEPAVAESVRAAGGVEMSDSARRILAAAARNDRPLTVLHVMKRDGDKKRGEMSSTVVLADPQGVRYGVAKDYLDRVTERGYSLWGAGEHGRPLAIVDSAGRLRGAVSPRSPDVIEKDSAADLLPYKVRPVSKELAALRTEPTPDRAAQREPAIIRTPEAAPKGAPTPAAPKGAPTPAAPKGAPTPAAPKGAPTGANAARAEVDRLLDVQAGMDGSKVTPLARSETAIRPDEIAARFGLSAQEARRVIMEAQDARRASAATGGKPGRKIPKNASVAFPERSSEKDPAGKVADDSSDYAPGSTLNSGFDPGLKPLLKEDVLPGIQAATDWLGRNREWVLAAFNPAAATPEAGAAARAIRDHYARFLQRCSHAERALASFEKSFRLAGEKEFLAFSDAIEGGSALPDENQQKIANTLRAMFDRRVAEIRAVNPDVLQTVIEDYFPHIWTDPKKAEAFYSATKRPLEGKKSFTRQRTYATNREGVEAGLEPVTYNPVTMARLKLQELDRYLMAQKIIREMKGRGLLKYIRATERAPEGYAKINDKFATVWGGTSVTVKEAFDTQVHRTLSDLLGDLGIEHERRVSMGKGVWGKAHEGGGRIETRFAGPDSVIFHELGHALNDRYGLWQYLSSPGLRVPGVTGARKKIAAELRALADLRLEGQAAGPGMQGYVRRREEKVANAVAALVYAPELFAEVAPTVKARLGRFLDEHPELHPLRDLRPSMALGEREHELGVGGVIKRGEYVAPDAVARVLNNFLSPGLRGNPAYDAARGLGNGLNQAQLGLSAFHALFSGINASVTAAALAAWKLSAGAENVVRGGLALDALRAQLGVRQVAQAAGEAARGVVPAAAAWRYLRQGAALRREYYAPGSQGEELARLLDAFLAGGGRAEQDPFYQTGAVKSFFDALAKVGDRAKKGSPIGAAAHLVGAVPKAYFAVIELAAKPMMEHYVPLLKMGAYADLMRAEMENLGPGVVATDRLRGISAEVVDSIENRFGQMAYDNLFWNKVLKDLLMVSVRSVGWNAGTLRELGGAAADALTSPARLFGREGGGAGNGEGGGAGNGEGGGAGNGGSGNGGSGNGGSGAADGEGVGRRPTLTHRMAFAIALPFVAGLLGAMYMYARGQRPKELKDYFYPRTGRILPNGEPERVVLPTYMKDVVSYSQHPAQTLLNKLHPLIGTVGDILQNKDFFNTEIYSPDDPRGEKAKEIAEYAASQFVPFSARNAGQVRKGGGLSPERAAESFLGVVPAPASETHTAAENMMRDMLSADMPAGVRTRAQEELLQKRMDLLGRARAGEDIRPAIRQMIRDGEMSRRMGRGLFRALRENPELSQFKRLRADQAVKVFKAATPQERALFARPLRHKAHGAAPAVRSAALDALRGMLGH